MKLMLKVMKAVTRSVQREKEHLRRSADELGGGHVVVVGARAAVAALEDLEAELDDLKMPYVRPNPR